MTFRRDPRRFSEPGSDAPPILQRGLREARARRVSEHTVERVADKLFPLITSGAIHAAAETPSIAASAVRMTLVSKLFGLFVITSLLSTGSWLVTRSGAKSEKSPVAAKAQPRLEAKNIPENILPDSLDARYAEIIPVAVPEIVPSSADPDAGVVAVAVAVASKRLHLRERYIEKIIPPKFEPITVTVTDPASELALLKEAQQALERRPKVTLALVSQHEKNHLQGLFAQEREILAIEALLKIGKGQDARQRGRRFLRDYPLSAHARRVFNLLNQYPEPSLELGSK